MPLEETITLRDAAIVGIHHTYKEGVTLTRTVIQATFATDLAETLGYKDILFLENDAPKSNIPSLELDTESASYHATFEAPESMKRWIQIEGNATSNYVVERMDEGIYRLTFWMKSSGNPTEFVDYASFIGNGTSLLKLTPSAVQKTIETSNDAKVVEVKTENGSVAKITGETVRKARRKLDAIN